MQLSEFQLSRVLLMQEIRALLVSPALWGMLIILSLLVGHSFIQAVELFSQASRTALPYPELAGGMNPLEGIFVPTFGAYYLVETLLLPFVIIRLTHNKETNPYIWRYAMQRSFYFFFTVLFNLTLIGCQTPSQKNVSLEDAKQMTAQIDQKPTYTMPPRTIKDMLSYLDDLSASNDRILAGFIQSANMLVPKGNWRSLSQRAESARMIGRHDQSIADCKNILEMTSNRQAHRVAYRTLAATKKQLGNYQTALAYAEKMNAISDNSGDVINNNATTSFFRAWNGDFAGAEKALKVARYKIPDMNKWNDQMWVPQIKVYVDLSEGITQYLRGDYSESESIECDLFEFLSIKII